MAILLTDDLLFKSGEVLGVDTLITRGFLPTAIIVVLFVVLYFFLVRKLKFSRAEVVMAGFTLMLTALTVCTVIGVWFRGSEMHLVWLTL